MVSNLVAIILARGGSKGVPKKNLLNIGKTSLLNHSIDFAVSENIFSKIYVSSDSDEILKAASLTGYCEVHKRSKESSNDKAKSEDALREVIKDKGLHSKFIALIEPTFPFRKSGIIIEMLNLLIFENADCCVSVMSIKRNPHNIYTIDEAKNLKKLFETKKQYYRRQELSEFKQFTNGVYVFKGNHLFNVDKITDGKLVGLEDDEALDVNIDTIEDVRYAEYIFKNGYSNKK
jgi:CMP-N,N'-diacetyllegionaminic acid synthase